MTLRTRRKFIPKIFSPDPNEVCDSINFLVQEKEAGIFSNIINEKILATTDTLLEFKCISLDQHEVLLEICSN